MNDDPFDRATILRLVDAAVRAPSADNRHHFRFVIREDGFDMLVDDDFLACDEPHRRLLTLLSYGAAVENLRLRMAECGRTFEPRWFPDGRADRTLLRLRWTELATARSTDPLAARIESRHTNRQLFGRKPVDGPARAALAAASQRQPDVALAWFDPGPRRRALLRAIAVAEATRFRSPSLHAELFGSIAFDAGWKRSVAEDLSPATLEVEPYLRFAFAALRRPRVMRLARGLGVHHMLGVRAGLLPAATASLLGTLGSTLPADDAALAVGAAFQRLWLAADAAGLALQPMVASAILAWQGPVAEPLRNRLADRLREAWEPLVGKTPPLVVFRVGHARPPTAVSGRRPAIDYLDEDMAIRPSSPT